MSFKLFLKPFPLCYICQFNVYALNKKFTHSINGTSVSQKNGQIF